MRAFDPFSNVMKLVIGMLTVCLKRSLPSRVAAAGISSVNSTLNVPLKLFDSIIAIFAAQPWLVIIGFLWGLLLMCALPNSPESVK